ncbi:MAG: primosomal protein N', partial [Clostridiales Family XIII bacterium]|nr:primosomal protein N' [Clostridiales Family XIII bacterium]
LPIFKNGIADIAVGARSAVFAPFENIGAIIVDEEHETTYKSDMTPKYDTIEVAVKRARTCNAVAVLGSATPSVVSMYRAKSGLYQLLTLSKRYNDNPMPKVTAVDMRSELERGNKSIFSAALYEKMQSSLSGGRQTILFLNRRGYSPFISCRKCGFVLRCAHCGLSMTWHKRADKAICHFCGASVEVTGTCPECGSPHLRHFGIGTEKVEELTAAAFPDVRIARLDLDTSAKKDSAARILQDFEKKKTDVLIGTQMVAKGLDFANVDLVGVIAADVSLNIPDFRSAERTFQLITQAAGRSGRGDECGEVVVQTYMPDNYAIGFAIANDYMGFYETELRFREFMGYPPFSDVVQITAVAASDAAAAAGAAMFRDDFLRGTVSDPDAAGNLLGPQKAAIYKLGEEYRYRLYLKVKPERRRAYEELLSELKRKINTGKNAKWRIIIDVNPFSLQ